MVYIGIGSNQGDPETHVRQAMRRLGELPHTELCHCSSLYRSKPMGPQDQPDYINAVVAITTSLMPLTLLDELQKIEIEHGRVRTGLRWGPRTLDLDILLFGEKVLNLPRLTVPHPGLPERAFVLYPLSEINPAISIPEKGSLTALLANCPAEGLTKITI